ncbi:257_t:CDS:2 [Cetraspora pellucida]|uniref:257_t:CDS:1 n=1 Tax=Cetraspora pellucida TaxID=1433469 RepID=A0A9N9AAK3_9GLOM|nr:257_t:CDS:2 [Cetraspora pellucida]
MQRTSIYYLLTFNYVILNSVIPLAFSLLNTRAQCQLRPKTGGFWIEVFPFLVDREGYNSFRRHFRINLATFQAIVAYLETHPRLANGVEIRMLEQTLGVSQGSVSHFTDRFLKALLDLENDLIAWPQGSRFENSEAEFGNPKLPNVIGAMDGSHIPIHPPSENGVRYVNHKNFHSINLLAVVDHEGCFTYIHAESVHDARVFYCSSLFHEISSNAELWVPGGTYIITDTAYPL